MSIRIYPASIRADVSTIASFRDREARKGNYMGAACLTALLEGADTDEEFDHSMAVYLAGIDKSIADEGRGA